MASKLDLQQRRRERTRYQIKTRGGGRVRLSVYRSGRHIYAQVIDDTAGRTIASASSLEKDLRGEGGADREAATTVGKLIAERALAAGITAVVFDRGPYLYHGRVKALADGAREGGLSF